MYLYIRSSPLSSPLSWPPPIFSGSPLLLSPPAPSLRMALLRHLIKTWPVPPRRNIGSQVATEYSLTLLPASSSAPLRVNFSQDWELYQKEEFQSVEVQSTIYKVHAPSSSAQSAVLGFCDSFFFFVSAQIQIHENDPDSVRKWKNLPSLGYRLRIP